MNEYDVPRYAVVKDGFTMSERESSALAFRDFENEFNEGNFLTLSVMNVRAMKVAERMVMV